MKVYPPPSKALLSRVRKLMTRKGREELRHFLVEGPCLVKECFLSGRIPRNLIFSDSASEGIHSEIEPFLINHKNLPCWTLSQKDFKSLCDTITPQGILGEFDQPHQPSFDLFGKWQHPEITRYSFGEPQHEYQKVRIVILDSIQEPGNVGTAIRCSVGLGANAMVLTCGCADLWNPKTLRASVGSIFRVPIWTNIPHREIEQRLNSLDYTTWVADPRGDSILDVKSIPHALVLVLGNEAHGPGPGWADLAGARKVGIPLSRKLESLNVGSALAAILAAIYVIDARQKN